MDVHTPTSSGGAVVSWSISPSVPSGMSFDTSTGAISGTPNVISPTTTYTVTATNSGGSDTTTILKAQKEYSETVVEMQKIETTKNRSEISLKNIFSINNSDNSINLEQLKSVKIKSLKKHENDMIKSSVIIP